MRQQLENMEGIYQPMQMQKAISDRQRVYTIGDLESLSATVLYSGKIESSFGNFTPLGFSKIKVGGSGKLPAGSGKLTYENVIGSQPKIIGSVSEFQKEGPQNISIRNDLGKYSPEAKGYSLIERYDSLNDGHSEGFHLNYDLTGINSGTSKKNDDGFKGLGPVHKIPLFDFDK